MEIITTHLGADFDAFASMLAARHLHPGAQLFFPGSREESVRRMLDAGLVGLEEIRRKEVQPERLTRVILCDIRQRDRIGIVAEWLRVNPAIELVVYDHHPSSPEDLPVGAGILDPAAGSTSTLMVEEVRRRGIGLPASEATVLLLGIYEDTGALTYATTGPRDLEAAAWLLRQGGDLAFVRRFATRSLDGPHLSVLHRMTEALGVHRVQGHRVGVVALELAGFVEELAPLVSRCLELYDLPLLFALFGEVERVSIIARGEVPGVDLGGLLARFADGGGHPTAASATVRGATVLELRERLLPFLQTALPPAARAADLMVASFCEVAPTATVAEAKEMLNRARVNAAPIVEGDRVVGAVTRQLLDSALQHRLDERAVETVMDRDLLWVTPEAAVDEVGEVLVGRSSRFVLVGDRASGRAAGLVTRMMILRHLFGRVTREGASLDRHSADQRRRHRPINRLLVERLPATVARQFAAARVVARRLETPVYAVGGLVRDLLLGRENADLDLVVEGDGLEFARQLGAELGGRAREHPAFLTAVVIDDEGHHLDVATARSEFYRAPAALPEVQTSALRQDLYRRDFTINTLAIRLGPEPLPELIDFFGGQHDLEAGSLRVLHSLSFLDDPTRILRAVRLELRLGFHLTPESARLVAVALAEGVFDRLSSARLRDELIQLLDAPATLLQAVERLAELDLLAVLAPGLALDADLRERLQRLVAAFDWFRLEELALPQAEFWRLALLGLAARLGDAGRRRFAARLALAGEPERLLLGVWPRLDATRDLLSRSDLPPHAAHEAIIALAGEEMLYLLAEGDETVRGWIRRDLEQLRGLRLALRGADLVALGVPPGPWIGETLRAVLRSRLDGRIDVEEELAFALGWLRESHALSGDDPVAALSADATRAAAKT